MEILLEFSDCRVSSFLETIPGSATLRDEHLKQKEKEISGCFPLCQSDPVRRPAGLTEENGPTFSDPNRANREE